MDVSDVGVEPKAGKPAFEDASATSVDLDRPGDLEAGALEGKIEASDPGEQ